MSLVLPPIAFTGYPEAGKSEAGLFFERTYGYRRGSFAARVRDEVEDWILRGRPMDEFPPEILDKFIIGYLNSITFEEVRRKPTSYTARVVLQWWGVEYRREHYGADYWVKPLLPIQFGFCFEDVRFQEELDAILQAGGWYCYILNPRKPNTSQHLSEAGFTMIPHTFIINDGSMARFHEDLNVAFAEFHNRRLQYVNRNRPFPV